MITEQAQETAKKLCEEINRIVDKGNSANHGEYLPSLVKATAELILASR